MTDPAQGPAEHHAYPGRARPPHLGAIGIAEEIVHTAPLAAGLNAAGVVGLALVRRLAGMVE